MTSRREFFGLLAAAPIAVPVIAKEMASAVSGPKYAKGLSFVDELHYWRPLRLNPRDCVPLDGRQYSVAEWTTQDGSKILTIGDVKLPLSTIPNRLYGAQINADGEAV